MTGYTNPDNLPYPDDYQQPADSPSAFQALAQSVQTALTAAKAYTIGRITQNWGSNTDVAISQAVVSAWKTAIEAREVKAGTGLSGGGTLADTRTLTVDTNTIATRTYVDEKVINGLGTSTTAAPSQAAVNGALAGKGPMAADATYNAPPGGVSCAVWPVGNLAPGQENETGIIPIPYGAYVFASVQHPSTYLHVVANLLSPTEVQLRIRCSTTQTTLTNIKVHVLIVNP